MAENNLTEIKALRKTEIFLELIQSTEGCCLVWSEIAPGQYSAENGRFSFVLSQTGTGISLDVFKDCAPSLTYSSALYEGVSHLYVVVSEILEKQFTKIPEEEEKLIKRLSVCHCPNVYDEVGSGGVVVGGMARVPERWNEVMMGGVVVGGTADLLVIGPDTYIYIYFDSSGSMNSTLFPLRTMRDTLLKDALLEFYGDEETYNEHVTIVEYSGERTLFGINHQGQAFPEDARNVVVLLFQDESSPYGAGFGPFNTLNRTAAYDTDLQALRNRLVSFPQYFYRAVFFQVEPYLGFKLFLEHIRDGLNAYALPWGLSDRDEFNYKFDVPDGGSPAFYLEEILVALEELGFVVR